MLLVPIWPNMSQQFHLDESITQEQAVCFSLEKGEFAPQSSEHRRNEVQFYWHSHQPMMANHSHDVICLINGIPLATGEQQVLTVDSEIHFGHFVITTKASMEAFQDPPVADSQIMSGQPDTYPEAGLPEIDDILSHGGHYISYLDDLNEAEAYGEQGPDVLKNLELEYKRFLLWGEQGREFMKKDQPLKTKLSANDVFLENIRDSVKDKTLTECILDSGGLIEKVTRELSIIDYLDDQPDVEKHDLLKILAPDHIVTKEKNSVPALVFQELHKLGLDSHL